MPFIKKVLTALKTKKQKAKEYNEFYNGADGSKLVRQLQEKLAQMEDLAMRGGLKSTELSAFMKIAGSLITELFSINSSASEGYADALEKLKSLSVKMKKAVVQFSEVISQKEEELKGSSYTPGLLSPDTVKRDEAQERIGNKLDRLEALLEEIEDFYPGTQKRLRKEYTKLAKQYNQIERDLKGIENEWQTLRLQAKDESNTEAKKRLNEQADEKAVIFNKLLKTDLKALAKIEKFTDLQLKQVVELKNRKLTLPIGIDGKDFTIDKRSLPGIDDLDEKDQIKLGKAVSAKIETGKELISTLLNPETNLDEMTPDVKAMTDLMWYFKTLAEKSVGEPFEKGASTLPDPGHKIRKYMDKFTGVYQRDSSHMTELQKGKKGEFIPRGLDLYDGSIKNLDELLPFSLNTVLFQSFVMNDNQMLYLKMETEGSRMGKKAGIFAGITGGIGGLVGLASSVVDPLHVKENVQDGYMIGNVIGSAISTPFQYVEESIKDRYNTDAPKSRSVKPSDWVDSARHGLNYIESKFGSHKDRFPGYREKMKDVKTLFDEEVAHPVPKAYGEMISLLEGKENLKVLLGLLKNGKYKKNVGIMLSNLESLQGGIATIKEMNEENISEHEEALITEDDMRILVALNNSIDEFRQLIEFEFDISDFSSVEAVARIGGEVVLTPEDIGMKVETKFKSSKAADKYLDKLEKFTDSMARYASLVQSLFTDVQSIKKLYSDHAEDVKKNKIESANKEDIAKFLSRAAKFAKNASKQATAVLKVKALALTPKLKEMLVPFADVDLITNSTEKKQFLKLERACHHDLKVYGQIIKDQSRYSDAIYVQIETLDFEFRSLCSEALVELDEEALFDVDEVVDRFEDYLLLLAEDVSDSLEGLVPQLKKECEENLQQISLAGSGLIPLKKDEKLKKQFNKRAIKNVERSRLLDSYSSLLDTHSKRMESIPESMEEEVEIVIVKNQYSKAIESDREIIKKWLKVLGTVDEGFFELKSKGRF